MSMNWSSCQTNIFENVRNTNANLAVSAVAGSGKTTTLVQIVNELDAEHSVLFAAFNKHIATELGARLNDKADAKTLHASGMKLLSKVRRIKVDENKYFAIIRKVGKELFPKELMNQCVRLTKKILGMVMRTLTEKHAFEEMLLTYGFIVEIADLRKKLDSGSIALLTKLLKTVVYESIELGLAEFEKTGVIDFDDMIALPVKLKLSGNYDVLLIDEAQDLNAAQMKLALSLTKRRVIAVGDAFQSINGFSGSLPDSFDQIVARTNARTLPLSVCYRCPTSHIALAQKLVPTIEAAPHAKVGEVHHIRNEEIIELAGPGDLIISRRNAPLIKLALKFIANQRTAKVRGRDFATDLMSLADAVTNHSAITGGFVEGFLTNLRFYYQDKAQILAHYDNAEAQIESLNDRISCLEAIATNTSFHNVEELKAAISNLFSDERATIYLSSVHRAKGLEADSVFIVDYDKIRIKYKGQLDWQAQQEQNLEYVAVTRAKEKLFLANE